MGQTDAGIWYRAGVEGRDATSDKQHAHDLIERLPESEVGTAVRFLEFMLMDPVARAVATAPPDTEPVTDGDRERLRQGEEWFRAQGGRGTPMSEVLAEFGLREEDFPS